MAKENIKVAKQQHESANKAPIKHAKTSIRLENLNKTFVNKRKDEVVKVVAVNDFDHTIEEGKLIGLLGPSGCGKSTTLFLIAGLHDPTHGSIYFIWEDENGVKYDEDVTNLSPENRGIGLVFQNYALYPHMTVAQNIMFPLGNFKGENKIDKEEQLRRAQEMANLVGIGELMERKPGELSGGQQQRVAIARALVKMPRVLLLDEPLSNLDARLRLQTREEIRRIQQETGITTVFVTHDQEEAMSISDEIIVMNEGVVQQVGAPQDVYENPVNSFVAQFLGTPPLNMFDAIYKDGSIQIGGQKVVTHDIKGLEEGEEVHVGIRPDAYSPSKEGTFKLTYDFIENIGRDMILVLEHDQAHKETFRIVIPADTNLGKTNTVNFRINEKKLFVFKKETGERVF